MNSPLDNLSAELDPVVDRALSLPRGQGRRLIAVAGPPATGKSTLSAILAERLTACGRPAAVTPMDGFHLDNDEIQLIGMTGRKGAPETFDLTGFHSFLDRLRRGGEVSYPLFDRAGDRTLPGAGRIDERTDIAVVEGNYLLLDEPGWAALRPLWDLTVWIDTPIPVLRARLIDRWRKHGLSSRVAAIRAGSNDIPNAKRVIAGSRPADMIV